MATRRKSIIMMILSAVAVLLCAALFSVSFAKWETNGNSSVEASGSVGQFYVEYPEYINDSSVTVPLLEDGVYYLQVPHGDNETVSDYYKLLDSDNTAYKYLYNVSLHNGDIIDLYYGTTVKGFKNRKNDSTDTANAVAYPIAGRNNKIKIIADGSYNFSYEFGSSTMHIAYSLNPTDPDTPTVVAPERTSKNSVKVKLTDTTVVFELEKDLSGNPTYLHIWKKDTPPGSTDTSITTIWPGLAMTTGADNPYPSAGGSTTQSDWVSNKYNCIEFGFSSADVGGIIINNNSKQIGDGNTYYDAMFSSKLTPNGTYTLGFGTWTHWDNFTSAKNWDKATIQKNVSVKLNSDSSSGGTTGGGGSGSQITPAVPDTTGATDFSEKLNADMPVRQAIMRGTNNGNIYSYSNYVCVSRKNSAATVNDNSICFIVFEIVDANGHRIENNTTKVNDVIITRALTANNGNPTGGNVDVPPRLYGEENVKTLSDINYEEKSGIGVSNAVEKYYDNGMYCILFFGDNEQQYFALDITIVTEGDAGEFYLKATASNINHWQRYNPGYGEPYGFYLGGFINNVTLWDPRRTTKFTENHADLTAADLITTDPFNDNNGTNPYTVQYPNRPIDITLTVNLTKGSEVKAYMLGKNGYRYAYVAGSGQDPKDSPTEGRVAYMLPGNIVMPDELKAKFVANGVVMTNSYELNLVIPESGEYTFHYVGTMTLATGDIDSNGGVEGVTSAKFHPGNANFMVDTLYITTTATSSSHTVTFYDSKGGNKLSSQTVAFGQTATKPADPTNGDKKFVGWYYETATGGEEQYDFGTVVSSDVSVYAKWDAKYTITLFNTNTAAGGFNVTSLDTSPDGKIADLPTTPSHIVTSYTFDGWFEKNGTTSGDWGAEITPSTVFGASTTIYAKWTKKQYKLTFDTSGLPSSVVTPDEQTVEHGDKATEPTLTLPEHYNLSGWYTAATGGSKFNFATATVTAGVTLYAQWYCDDGLYANGVFVKAWSDNGSTSGQTRLKAEKVHLIAGSTLTLWKGNSKLTTHVAIRQGSPAATYFDGPTINNTNDTITNGTKPLKVMTGGWFSLYYDTSNKTVAQDNEKGIWAIFESSYADLTLNANDGVYNGSTRLGAFVEHEGTPWEIIAQDVELSADMNVAVRYNGSVVAVAAMKSDTKYGTLTTDGKVSLKKGTYSFYYNYADKIMYVEGTEDAPQIIIPTNAAVFKFTDATIVIQLGYLPSWGDSGSAYAYIKDSEWNDRYKLDGSSTHTINAALSTTSFYIGFMQGIAGKSAELIDGSKFTDGKVNVVTNKSGNSDTFDWNGSNWRYVLTTQDISYS